MTNWHRKIWTLTPQLDGGGTSHELLFKAGPASNQFWLEPFRDAQGTLRFAVTFVEGAMTDVWKNRIMVAKGHASFELGTEPDVTTERLESLPFPITIGSTGEPEDHLLNLYVGTHPQHPDQWYLHAELALSSDGGAGGIVGAGQSGRP